MLSVGQLLLHRLLELLDLLLELQLLLDDLLDPLLQLLVVGRRLLGQDRLLNTLS